MKHLGSITFLKQTDTGVLIQLVRSGDRDAFSELMTRYDSIVRRTACSILKNLEDAEDAMQDTHLRVFRKIHTFKGTAKFSTWLTRIVINTSLMRLRQRRAHPASSLEELIGGDVSSCLPLADLAPDPEQQFYATDLKMRLYEAVHKLPDPLREIAEDQIYAELAIKDLADKGGLTLAAAKSRAYRARKVLIGSLRPPQHRLHIRS